MGCKNANLDTNPNLESDLFQTAIDMLSPSHPMQDHQPFSTWTTYSPKLLIGTNIIRVEKHHFCVPFINKAEKLRFRLVYFQLYDGLVHTVPTGPRDQLSPSLVVAFLVYLASSVSHDNLGNLDLAGLASKLLATTHRLHTCS